MGNLIGSAAMDGRFVILATQDDRMLKTAAMDGRFVIFAIRDDRQSTIVPKRCAGGCGIMCSRAPARGCRLF
jgi:hypothetical protein